MLLEERTERFSRRDDPHRRESDESPGAMRKTMASKEGHECCLKRLYSLKEVSERPFSANGIADQQREKIDGFIGPEASAYQAHEARAKAEIRPFFSR
jgi:hypothetical protein